MKITGFVGSPRKKGNSDIFADTFLEGAESNGAEVKKHFLAELDINQCRGCFRNCMVKPGHKCGIFDDDMSMLIEDMIASDVLLFVSPLYCSTFTSTMAMFFERCLPLIEVKVIGQEGTKEGVELVGNPVMGKKAVIGLVQDLQYPIVGELALKVFEHVVGQTYRMNVMEKVQVIDVRDKGDINKKTDRLKEIKEIGEKYAVD